MKKILIFSITYFPFVGGAEVAVKEITDRINDIEFDLITAKLKRGLPDVEKIGNINVIRVGSGNITDKYLFPILAFLKAQKLNKEYNIVWAIMANYAGLAALFYKFKNKKVKYLLTMQSGDTDFFIWLRTWFWYPLYKMVYTKADHIQAISKFLKTRAIKYGYKKEISIVPNGVDLKRFNKEFSEDEKNDLKEKLGITFEDKVVVTASRLVVKNAINDLIRGVKELPVKLLIIGEGKLKQKLEIGNNGKVIFLGHLSHQELPKYLSISDVFVRPSLSEGLGNAFLEAMAAKVPVVATPVGGILDFLEDSKTGLFCHVKNPASIAEKIKLLTTDSNLRQTIINNGYQMVVGRYSWDFVAEEINNMFEKKL